MNIPEINGLLNYHIRGDEALLWLGRTRYEQAGLGAEIHPASPEHLSQILQFVPAGRSSTVHLPYAVSLDHDATDLIRDFVLAGGDKISGYVLHDTHLYAEDFNRGLELVKTLSRKLDGKSRALVYIEYAVGLPFEVYLRLAEEISGLPNIGICIDIGHIGINATVDEYYIINPGVYVRELKPGKYMSLEMYAGIASAVKKGRNRSFEYIESLIRTGAQMHFHLHDGHPMSTFSPYGVCDHLPFFWEIPTGLAEVGSVSGIYGVSGLQKVLEIIFRNSDFSRLSFTLEIHPQPGQSELSAKQQEIFSNWSDLTNARAMNFWMDIVIQNAMIFRDLCREILICDD